MKKLISKIKGWINGVDLPIHECVDNCFMISRHSKGSRWIVNLWADGYLFIGCKSEPPGGWTAFFSKRRYFGTNPWLHPIRYHRIARAYRRMHEHGVKLGIRKADQ